MKILFYITQSDPVAEQLQNVIATFSWKDQLDMCRTLESLTHRLCRPRGAFTNPFYERPPFRPSHCSYFAGQEAGNNLKGTRSCASISDISR